jgi:hypothetical protein
MAPCISALRFRVVLQIEDFYLTLPNGLPLKLFVYGHGFYVLCNRAMQVKND